MTHFRRAATAAALLALLALTAPAQDDKQRGVGSLTPQTTAEDALTQQLHTATLITADIEKLLRFYRDGLGLTVRGPVEVDEKTRGTQRKLWGIPEDVSWKLYLLGRPTVPGTIQVRVLVLNRETPLIRSSWERRQPAPYAMGFPCMDLEPWDAELREMGYESTTPEMMRYPIKRPDGTSYTMTETIFKGPDFVHGVTLARYQQPTQPGPVDEQTGRGGPVYSTQVIENSDAMLSFFVDVLGFELRSDQEWGEGEKAFRFAIVFAPGASFGHMLFLDYRENTLEGSGAAPRAPNRGLAMWSYPVRDFEEIQRRVEKAKVPVVHGPVSYESPSLGKHRVMTVLAPNGFMVELFEPAKS